MDIVERLRNLNWMVVLGSVQADRRDAADEIEKLREALRVIGYGPPHEGEPRELLNQFVDIARAALKENS